MHFVSAFEGGGTENMLISMIKKINDENKDLNIVVVVLNNLVNKDLKNELKNNCKNTFFLGRKPSDIYPKYLFQIQEIIKKFKIDIIHTHDFGSRIRGVFFSIINPKVKVIFTAHAVGIFRKMHFWDKFFYNIYIKKTIAISDIVYKEAIDENIKNVVKIYNCIDLSKFNFKDKKINKGSMVNIINVARVDYSVKGQDILIKALKILKDKNIKFKCLFVGDNTGTFEVSYKGLVNLLNEFDLKNEVDFTGNRLDVNRLLEKSDMFILPSRVEGFGLVIIEAMASGIPVICSNIDGPSELIENAKNGLLFENENYIDLADKIVSLNKDLNLYYSIRNNAFEFSRNFDITCMLREYINNYCEIR